MSTDTLINMEDNDQLLEWGFEINFNEYSDYYLDLEEFPKTFNEMSIHYLCYFFYF